MPRYFFHTADNGREIDRDGMDLPDNNAARIEAIRYAGSVLQNEPDALWDGRDFRVEVTDEQSDLLFTIIALAVDAPAAEPSR